MIHTYHKNNNKYSTQQLNPSSVGLLETFYSSIKPRELFGFKKKLVSAGSLGQGKNEFPFSFDLKPTGSENTLYPTFHGVYVSISYGIKVECEGRGWGSQNITKEIEFILDRLPDKDRSKGDPVEFKITKSSLENVHQDVMRTLPDFHFEGRIPTARCPVNSPFTGELEIKDAKAPIKSVSLQLVRVETVTFAEGTAKEPTEVQNIQIAQGDVCRKLVVPLYMIFPRLFTCPTLITENFKIEFEMNLIVLFEDSHMITENFPLVLIK